MCTVSIIRTRQDVLRLVCNRDELRTRATAELPQRRQYDGRLALMPIDLESGGTWIAVNDAGLVFTILNANRGCIRVNPRARSRGDIIPSLLAVADLDEAIERIDEIDAIDFNPFHLIALARTAAADVLFDGHRVVTRTWSLDRLPVLFTSSGLGDELVDPPRRELFDRMLLFGQTTARTQDEFHRHRWPDRSYLSVNMSRPDARTVSRTVVELAPDRAWMSYEAIDEVALEPESFPRAAREIGWA